MAFAFPKNYKNLSLEEKAEWRYIKKIFDKVSVDFKVSKISKPNFTDFQIFNAKNSLKVLQSYKIQQGTNYFTICLIQYNTSHLEAHHYGGTIKTNVHKYLFGFVKTTIDFGKAFLRPETIGDKISEFFSPNELDINGFDKFNRNYYLLSSDKEKFLTAVNGKLINSIAELIGVEMEFSGRKCFFRLKKAIDVKEAIDLCKLGIKIANEVKNNSI